MMEPTRLTPEVLAAAAARADEEDALDAPPRMADARAPENPEELPPLPRVTSPRLGSNSPRAVPARKSNYGSIQPLGAEFSRRDDSDLEGSEADGPEGGGGSTVSEEFTSYDRARLQLYRKVPVKAGLINPYRFLVFLRLLVMLAFFGWRVINPNEDAFGLWVTSVICEIWIGLAWLVDQGPRLAPVNRETFLDRLTLKYDRENEDSKLQAVDFFINSSDPDKDSPILTCNAALSVLALDYPVDKVSCYVNDEGASMLTFQVLTETASFARDWVPFCKKFDIEPRAPEQYFAIKVDYTKDKKHPDFVKERRAMKHHYEEFKVRINALVAKCSKQKPLEGWRVADGTPWPGNNPQDHPGMIQILLQPNVNALDNENNVLPRLVYISREKRPGYDTHRKSGAMNALMRASALITNAPYICFMDCDTYVNNSQGIKEAMCFFEDPQKGSKVSFVQFPLRYDGVDPHDRYNNHNTAYYDIYLKGLDGLQGPTFAGNGCVFRRVSLYGALPPQQDQRKKAKRGCLGTCCSCFPCCLPARPNKTSEMDLEEQDQEELQLMPFKWHTARFGTCENFVSSTFEPGGGAPVNSPRTTLSDVILVISCGYEENTQWGKEIGWVYCSSTEHIVTGQKIHARGWRSIYCMPKRPGFRRPAQINLADRLHEVLTESLGAVETYWSKYNVLWWRLCSSKLKKRQRLAYLNAAAYPMVAIPVAVYCILPAICLITNKFIVGKVSNVGAGIFVAYALVYGMSCWFEMRWSAVPLEEWWRAQQMWVINCTSGYLAAVGQGSLRVFAGCEGALKAAPHEHEDGYDYAELYTFRWTWLLITPLTVILINCFGIVAGLAKAVNNKNPEWGKLAVRLLFAIVVVTFMYPFAKGLMGRHKRVPTIVIVWCLMLAIIFSLLWVQVLF